jgi:hypothetical protein
MKKLRTLKLRGHLREQDCKYAPAERNVTRWSSTYDLISSFQKLSPFFTPMLQDLRVKDKTLYNEFNLVLAPINHDAIAGLMEKLRALHDATILLQGNDITLHLARKCFEILSQVFPSLADQLSPTALIVKNPSFESAIAKLQSGNEADLLPEELEQVSRYKRVNVATSNSVTAAVDYANVGYAELNINELLNKESAEIAAKKQRTDSYMCVNHVLPTSNIVERLFSGAKLVYSDLRSSLTPEHLEMVLYLQHNREYWGLEDIERLRCRKRRGGLVDLVTILGIENPADESNVVDQQVIELFEEDEGL